MTLTRDQILARRAQLPRETVEVPDLGGSVLIRGLTLKEVAAAQKAARASADPLSIYPHLVRTACINDDGTPVFVGEDIKALDDLPFAAVDAIARAVVRMNRLSEESQVPKDSTGLNGSSID